MDIADPTARKTTQDDASMLSRRKWLARVAGTALVSAVGTGIYTWRFEPYWVEVVERDLAVRGLPAALEGRTLVQLSDIHVGPQVDDEFLTTWFRRIADWHPDFVVFTGDFLTLRPDNSLPLDQLERVLSEFPQGSIATIGILGNHDYGLRWRDRQAADSVVGIAKNAGIKMLRNETTEMSGLQIVGFDDYWSPNYRASSVLKHVDLERPTIALCHNPDMADLPIWAGYRGWILSGHTHGGQCKAPFLTPPRLPIRNTQYASGEIPLADGRTLYVNRALGHSFPVRFNARPEITVFRLRNLDSMKT